MGFNSGFKGLIKYHKTIQTQLFIVKIMFLQYLTTCFDLLKHNQQKMVQNNHCLPFIFCITFPMMTFQFETYCQIL